MSARTETIIVQQSQPTERLDTFLRTQFPAMSRGALQRLLEAGHIRVNGQPAKVTHHPRAGELIEIHLPEARPALAQRLMSALARCTGNRRARSGATSSPSRERNGARTELPSYRRYKWISRRIKK